MTIGIEELRGRIVDLDSHLMMFPTTIASFLPELGERNARLAHWQKAGATADPEQLARVRNADRASGDPWHTKGWLALGAQDAAERVEALDMMGISWQLLFPTGLWWAMYRSEDYAQRGIAQYNDYVLDWAAQAGGRVKPACLLNMHDVDRAVAEAERVVAGGAAFVQVASNQAPAGLSPAAPQWDPLWRVLAEAGVPALHHAGGQRGFVSEDWKNGADSLQARPMKDTDPGEALGLFGMATNYMASEAYLTAMIFGGVFERHPDLRFGVIEIGANWVPSWAERLDRVAGTFARRVAGVLSDTPSSYIRRNVRVTPLIFEPVGEMIEQSGMPEVFCFSTDYPHPEGGVDPIGRFYESVAPLGDDIIERFYVTNGAEFVGSPA